MQTFLVLDPNFQVLLRILDKIATVVAVIAYFGHTLLCILEGKSNVVGCFAVQRLYNINTKWSFFCIRFSGRPSVQLKQIENLKQSASF